MATCRRPACAIHHGVVCSFRVHLQSLAAGNRRRGRAFVVERQEGRRRGTAVQALEVGRAAAVVGLGVGLLARGRRDRPLPGLRGYLRSLVAVTARLLFAMVLGQGSG